VDAYEKKSGKKGSITIKNEKSRLTDSQVQDMVKQANEMRAQDRKSDKRSQACFDLIIFCEQMRKTVKGERTAP